MLSHCLLPQLISSQENKMQGMTQKILMSLIVIIMIAVGTVIAIKPSINSQHHQKYNEAFSELENYYLRMSENAYKAAQGGVGHYDFLQANLVKLKRYANAMLYTPDYLSDDLKAKLVNQAKTTIADVDKLDQQAIEFMRVNSLLKNSTMYLPALIREFIIKEKTMHMKQLLAFLEKQIMHYQNDNSSASEAQILGILETVSENTRVISKAHLSNLKTHILIILEYHSSVTDILKSISESKVEKSIDTAKETYSKAFYETNSLTSILTDVLIGLVTALLIVAGLLMINVQRSNSKAVAASEDLKVKLKELDQERLLSERQLKEVQIAQQEVAIHQKDSEENNAKLVAAIDQINQLMDKVSQGYFAERLDETYFQGNLSKLRISVHQALDTLQASMKEISQVSEKLSNGDLTSKITGQYSGELAQVKQAINGSIENLAKLISQVSFVSHGIKVQIGQLRSDSESVALSSTRQSETLISTINAVDNTTEKIQSNTQNTQHATQITSEQVAVLNEGMQVMTSMVSAMDDIKHSSERIADIISLIDSIAFQTNLLALNAAVEAARAGEKGRGFAVVAGEVRNLAGKSAEAAKGISSLIEDSTTKVQAGVVLVNNVSLSLESIKQKVETLQSAVKSIDEACTEQSQSAHKITQAVSEAENLCKQNSNMAQNTVNHINQVVEASLELDNVVRAFKL